MYNKLYNDNHLYLYHFTDVSNIGFIKKYGGLYSYKQLQNKKENNSIKYVEINSWSSPGLFSFIKSVTRLM